MFLFLILQDKQFAENDPALFLLKSFCLEVFSTGPDVQKKCKNILICQGIIIIIQNVFNSLNFCFQILFSKHTNSGKLPL